MSGFDYQAECPGCGATFPVPRIREGREESCPVCGAVFKVSEDGAELAVKEPGEPQAPEERGPLTSVVPAAEATGPVLVCCAREQKLNPLEVAPVVRQFTGLAHQDAAIQVAKGMGILAEGLSPDIARAMMEILRARGVETFAFPVAGVPPVEKKLPITRIHGADEAALRIQTDAEGTVKAVSWKSLAAGICTQPKFGRTMDAEGGPGPAVRLLTLSTASSAGSRLMRRAGRHQEEPHKQVTLVLRDPAGKAYLLAFSERQVRYAYLGERLRPSVAQNLGEFLGDVLKWGDHAFFAEGFMALARGETQRVTRVVGRVDSENYLRWAICCAAARGLFGAG